MSIRISIVTVVYNGEGCIEKTIKSITGQTYANTEYIIIDGKSRDNTRKIIEKYQDHIDVIVSEPDLGLYDAMNKGIERANGDYVIFLNCDDTFYADDTLKKIVDNIDVQNKPDFIYGDATEENKESTQTYLKKARNHNWIWYGMFAHHQSMLYNLALTKKYNLRYELQYKIGADYAFTATFLQYARKIMYFEKEPICFFKQNGISAVNYKTGLKEQWFIRKNIFHHPFIVRMIIFIVHFSLIHIRRKLPYIYNILRFRWKGAKNSFILFMT